MAKEAIRLNPQSTGNGKIRYPKMYKGNRFPSPVFDSDSRRNRSEAWNLFLKWRREIDATEKAALSGKKQSIDAGVYFLATAAERISAHTSPFNASIAAAAVAGLRQLQSELEKDLRRPDSQIEGIDEKEVERLKTHTEFMKAELGQLSGIDDELKASVLMKAYLSYHAKRTRSNQITAGSFGRIRSNIKTFVGWYGEYKSLGELTKETVSQYHTHLLTRIEKGEPSSTIWGHFQGFQQFVEWAANQFDDDVIAIPKNLRTLTISKDRVEPDPFTVEEFNTFYEASPEKTKLYLCLMLNFAGYQSDVSDLDAKEVDWINGRVIRARSKKKKSQKKGDVIKINYLLWDETFKLLKKYGCREGMVLRNQNGNPLVVSALRANEDKEYRNDNIQSAFSRVKQKLKNNDVVPPKKGLKQLRKTGSNFIAENEDFAEFYGMILDHTSVRNQHYLKSGKPYPKFDKAIVWLGEQFGFKTKRKHG